MQNPAAATPTPTPTAFAMMSLNSTARDEE